MLKKLCAAALSALMLTAAVLPAQAVNTPIPHEQQKQVTAATQKGLVPPALQNRYYGNITRQELCALGATILTTAGQRFTKDNDLTFTDTADENIANLVLLGVIDGKADGSFGAKDPVTRQELAVFLYRMAASGSLAAPYPAQLVGDDFSVDAQDAVAFCVNTGIMDLVDGSFEPDTLIPIGEAIAAATRLYDYAQGTSLNLTASGHRMLYSNNPEELKNGTFEKLRGGRRGIYTSRTGLARGETIDTEYYHWNYTGMTLITGVAITNTTDKDGDFTVLRSGTATGMGALDVTQKCNMAYLNSDPLDRVTVPAGETVFAVRTEYPKSLMINSRTRLIAHDAGMIATQFVLYDKTAGPSFIPTLPHAVDDKKGRTSATFPTSERNASIDASKTQLFTLCGNTVKTWAANTGEYPVGTESPALAGLGGNGAKEKSHFLNGNYGTVYNLKLSNAKNKTLSVRPNDPTVKTARYLLYSEKDGWQTITTSKDEPYTLPLTKNNEEVRFLLLGGNTGNIGFCLSDTPAQA